MNETGRGAVAEFRIERRMWAVMALAMSAVALWLSGCVSHRLTPEQMSANATAPAAQKLNPGDVIKIAFPGAPTLDTQQQIRLDGFVNLSMVGEIKAADLTPAELEKLLQEKYASQIVSKEIKVTVVTASYTIFVGGLVRNPGKIVPNRVLTVLEAIMEAGGYEANANLKAVRVIRIEGGQSRRFEINVKDMIDGKNTTPFYLKSNDVVLVDEKFVLF